LEASSQLQKNVIVVVGWKMLQAWHFFEAVKKLLTKVALFINTPYPISC
jgi:hypothetical protein